MTDRGPDGKFVPGSKGGPGRKKLEVSEGVTALIDSVVTVEDWGKIIIKLRDLAIRGNLAAINALMDRRFGKPMQRNEVTGANGGPVQITRVEIVLPNEEADDSTG